MGLYMEMVLDELTRQGCPPPHRSASAESGPGRPSVDDDADPRPIGERDSDEFLGDTAALGSICRMSADVVGRIVAGLAQAAQLLRYERSRVSAGAALEDSDVPTNLIVEWGITLAWGDNPAVAQADEMLIDESIAVLTSAVGCIEANAESLRWSDPVQLRDSLFYTIAALREPLWRRP